MFLCERFISWLPCWIVVHRSDMDTSIEVLHPGNMWVTYFQLINMCFRFVCVQLASAICLIFGAAQNFIGPNAAMLGLDASSKMYQILLDKIYDKHNGLISAKQFINMHLTEVAIRDMTHLLGNPHFPLGFNGTFNFNHGILACKLESKHNKQVYFRKQNISLIFAQRLILEKITSDLARHPVSARCLW